MDNLRLNQICTSGPDGRLVKTADATEKRSAKDKARGLDGRTRETLALVRDNEKLSELAEKLLKYCRDMEGVRRENAALTRKLETALRKFRELDEHATALEAENRALKGERERIGERLRLLDEAAAENDRAADVSEPGEEQSAADDPVTLLRELRTEIEAISARPGERGKKSDGGASARKNRRERDILFDKLEDGGMTEALLRDEVDGLRARLGDAASAASAALAMRARINELEAQNREVLIREERLTRELQAVRERIGDYVDGETMFDALDALGPDFRGKRKNDGR